MAPGPPCLELEIENDYRIDMRHRRCLESFVIGMGNIGVARSRVLKGHYEPVRETLVLTFGAVVRSAHIILDSRYRFRQVHEIGKYLVDLVSRRTGFKFYERNVFYLRHNHLSPPTILFRGQSTFNRLRYFG